MVGDHDLGCHRSVGDSHESSGSWCYCLCRMGTGDYLICGFDNLGLLPMALALPSFRSSTANRKGRTNQIQCSNQGSRTMARANCRSSQEILGLRIEPISEIRGASGATQPPYGDRHTVIDA